MKTLTLALFAILFATLSFGQSLSDPAGSSQLCGPATAPIQISADHAQLASIENRNYAFNDFVYAAPRGGSGDDVKCGRYKKMKLIGIIAASVGGALLITGIALEAVAVHNETGAYYNGYTYVAATTDAGLVVGGGVCIGFGLVGVGGGVPLAVIGSIKSKRYCGGGSSYMQLSTKGNGLALNF